MSEPMSEPITDHYQPQPPSLQVLALHGPVPRFEFGSLRQSRNVAGNAWAVLRGPRAPKLLRNPFLRDCAVSQRAPRGAFFIALLWHGAALALILSLGRFAVAQPAVEAAVPQELIWYGPARDLPDILPLRRIKAPLPPALEESQPDRGSEAFHPRLTIINRPLHPNHPRQTLIQPEAPPEPPKILPALPNIVEWDAPSKPHLDAAALALRQAKRHASAVQDEVAAPELRDAPKQLEALNLAAPDANVQKPALPVSALSAPQRATSARVTERAAPEASAFSSGDLSDQRLIALSANPAPVAPPSEPLGNLSSRLNISPNPAKSGTSGGSTTRGSGEAGGGSGPSGLSITGAGRRLEGLSGSGNSARSPVPPSMTAAAPRDVPSRTQPNSLAERARMGLPPERLLGDKRVYSLNVNMPNLTSASGSWILTFAEMDQGDNQGNNQKNNQRETSARSGELTGPVPLHKVDPKYPPLLRGGHVEGEVLLYAVIRKDGTVDSIQLLNGVDPDMDLNAMQALAQWKFRPGQRHGEPVELEAIVRIPLHASVPQN